MGWLFSSKWLTRKDLIDHLVKDSDFFHDWGHGFFQTGE